MSKTNETLTQDTNSDQAIRFDNVSYMYKDGTIALRNINYGIDKGDVIGIIGQNGSGKTTLVKHLNGLLRPTIGRVLLHGHDTKSYSIGKLSCEVGMLFQDPNYQLFSSNVEKEVHFGLRFFKLTDEEKNERVLEALRTVQLENRLEEYPFELSLGEKQRLCLACVLAIAPEIIVVDEPTTGQDTYHALQLMDILMELNRKENKTIIIVTHDMQVIARYARRVAIMSESRLICDKPTVDAFNETEILRKAFVEPPQIVELAHTLNQKFPENGFGNVLTIQDMVNRIVTKK